MTGRDEEQHIYAPILSHFVTLSYDVWTLKAHLSVSVYQDIYQR